jgi:hypothetical protein
MNKEDLATYDEPQCEEAYDGADRFETCNFYQEE